MRKDKRIERLVKCYSDLYDIFVISDAGVDWISKKAYPVMAPDFMGYTFRLHPKLKINCMVNLSGDYVFFSSNPRKPILTCRQVRKAVNYLIHYNILRLRTIEVYPEYESYRNIPFDTTKAHLVHTFLFDEPY